MLGAVFGPGDEMENAIGDVHVSVGRNDVDTVGLYADPFRDLHDGHPGMRSEQFGKEAVVFGGKVLDDDESGAEFRGERFEKQGAGFEAADGSRCRRS